MVLVLNGIFPVYHKRNKVYSLCNSKPLHSRSSYIFKTCIKELEHDLKRYGLHILRSCGNTSVAHHSDNSIKIRFLKLHGRWKTDVAKDV